MVDSTADDRSERLDSALVSRGLARSRNHASRLIGDGRVRVADREVRKPALRVAESDVVSVTSVDHYVSRAAQKLVHALDVFSVSVSGRVALDVGASTGGFTQVLLERGADEVIALDVGRGQLAPGIRSDPRVRTVEGFNAREMTASSLAAAARSDSVHDLVVSDVSFISIRLVLPAVSASVAQSADFIVLVKPQFEVGRVGVREGIVRDRGLRREAVADVLWSAWDLGLGVVGVTSSPVLGSAGNHEYLVHLSRIVGSNPTEWRDEVDRLTHG